MKWLGLCLVTGCSLGAADLEQDAERAWSEVSQFLFPEALERFSTLEAAHGTSRHLRLGRAVCILATPKRQQGNIDEATLLLDGIVAENGSDDLAVVSRYLLARIAQVHALRPDAVRAAGLFEDLLRDFSAHPLAGKAAIKLALLRLYVLGDASPEQRVRDALALMDWVRSPADRKDFHLIVAGACQFFDLSPVLALHHLQEARATGAMGPARLAAADVVIGELARSLGDRDVAIAAYREFVRRSPRDIRAFTVRGRIEELEGGARR